MIISQLVDFIEIKRFIMNQTTMSSTYLKNYSPPSFFINSVNLHFDLGETESIVTAITSFSRNPQQVETHLCLQGSDHELIAIELNGEPLAKTRYQLQENQLIIDNVADNFTLLTKVKIKPQENTQLSGLYKTNNIFFMKTFFIGRVSNIQSLRYINVFMYLQRELPFWMGFNIINN